MSQSKLNQRWAQLESQRVDLMNRLSKLDDARLNATPPSGGWSVMQVLLHLQSAEKFSESYMRKKMQFVNEAPPQKAGFAAWARTTLLNVYMKSPFKAKAPKNLENFPAHTDFKEFEAKWIAQRQGLGQFLTEMQPNLLEKELFKHQVIGKMSPLQMLEFCHAHVSRHIGQIERNLAVV